MDFAIDTGWKQRQGAHHSSEYKEHFAAAPFPRNFCWPYSLGCGCLVLNRQLRSFLLFLIKTSAFNSLPPFEMLLWPFIALSLLFKALWPLPQHLSTGTTPLCLSPDFQI
ncbi:hypothetical protein K443DRAFT_315548 [Laccaria amethystina LaAM-08-1]|uniref:Uncharacterized protein n=1 Tax=Laccaria amethystina LaAM-08-1 TaxID=1095629 RepID=A0A0C9XI24_9AGAR|nr:hypothetical protein K443DRAFT_315548 [Laccaria amethystina LaAM-08-1]